MVAVINFPKEVVDLSKCTTALTHSVGREREPLIIVIPCNIKGWSSSITTTLESSNSSICWFSQIVHSELSSGIGFSSWRHNRRPNWPLTKRKLLALLALDRVDECGTWKKFMDVYRKRHLPKKYFGQVWLVVSALFATHQPVFFLIQLSRSYY